ncbi:MAG: response regulator [Oscillospiraceae bacterium]|jgi:two-component system chemotaxis response regulator CheY|nr:response regulator [Oscillospiraceae bacterium]MDE6899695.1 response regulator [Oscillospiraceae bacterium]
MKKRLMVVDDSRVLEYQICKLLEDTDYEVAAYCENGEEAIARYEEVRPDIVTMDIIMPGIDGLEAAQIIAEAHPDARIIMISSLAYEDTLQEAEAVGAKLFLYKPIDRENLLDALEQVMGEDGCQESCAEK